MSARAHIRPRASVCARAGERSFLPRICKLNNKYRGIYTRKSSAFRLHAARARRGLVARPRGDGDIHSPSRSPPRRWTYFVHAHTCATWMHVHGGIRGEGTLLRTPLTVCAVYLLISFPLFPRVSLLRSPSLSAPAAERSGVRLERVRLSWSASASLSSVVSLLPRLSLFSLVARSLFFLPLIIPHFRYLFYYFTSHIFIRPLYPYLITFFYFCYGTKDVFCQNKFFFFSFHIFDLNICL